MNISAIMGLLRFLLAISVILSHTGSQHGLAFVDGQTAVEAFFIISGFYITLILNEKYVNVNNSYWLFISNRFLRLYPVYWVVLILTLLSAWLIPHFNAKTDTANLAAWQAYGSNLSIESYISLAFTNLCLFGQDAVMFLGINLKSGSLFYAPNFNLTNPPLYKFLLVPQAWSIGLELTFYLIAPLIVRRKYPVILGLLLISMALKIYGSTHGFALDPWSYRFFPFECMFFLAGSLAYFIYKNYVEHISLPNYVYIAIYAGLALFTVGYSFVNIGYPSPVYTFFVFVSIPFLFRFTKKMKADRFLGELSYPIYITHMLVLNLVTTIGFTPHLTIPIVGGTIMLSVLLVKTVGERIEQLRQGRVKSGKGVNKMADALSVKFTG